MSEPWRLVLTGAARRDLNSVSPGRAVFPILETLNAIAANPQRMGKALGFQHEGSYVARRGPFRVIYKLDESRRLVQVTAIGHRSHVYRRR